MRARAKQSEQYKYGGLTTQQFAERCSISQQQVRDLIAAKWFRWDGDRPECINVASPTAKIPSYRILPSAVDRWMAERSVSVKQEKGKAA